MVLVHTFPLKMRGKYDFQKVQTHLVLLGGEYFNERLYVFLLYRYQSGAVILQGTQSACCALCVSSHNAHVCLSRLKGSWWNTVKILGRPLRPQYVKLTEGEEVYCVVCNHTDSWQNGKVVARSQATQPPHTNMFATHKHTLTQEFKAKAVKTLWAVERFCSPYSSACYHSIHRKRFSVRSQALV